MRLTLFALVLFSSIAIAKPLPDENYKSCLSKGEKSLSECEENLVSRRRIEAYYIRPDIYNYHEYYDKFKSTYDFEWNPLFNNDGTLNLESSLTLYKDGSDSGLFLIHIAFFDHDNPSSYACKETDWLIDGKRLEPKKFIEYHSEGVHISTSVFSENIFKKIINSDDVEFQYCDKQGKITPEQFKALRFLYRRLLDEKGVDLLPSPLFNKKDP